MKNLTLVATFMVALFITCDAQNLRRGGFPLEEVTYQWVEQGLEIHADCEDEGENNCYFVNTDLATMYYFLEDGLVTIHLVWPTDEDALSTIITGYNNHYDKISEFSWKIDVADGLVLINLKEQEEEYFFEYTYLIHD